MCFVNETRYTHTYKWCRLHNKSEACEEELVNVREKLKRDFGCVCKSC